jgi:hypothetical protein
MGRSRSTVVGIAALTVLAGMYAVPASGATTYGAVGTKPTVCSSPVSGPASAPAGAVVVNPATDSDLTNKTNAYPAGTTFWLAPGVHTLGTSQYGQVIPKDNDVFLGAPGAVLDGKGLNNFAFTQHAKNVTIQYLTVRNFNAPVDQGVVNHDSGDGWTIADNTMINNHGAAMMAGAGQKILRNCLKDNGQYGINAYQVGDGIAGLTVEGNEIAGNNTDDLETKNPGCGCTGGMKFWAVNGADVRNNWIHNNHSVGLWADTNNNDFLIENNWITDNDSEAVFYEVSYNLTLRNNTITGNTIVKGKSFAARGDNFPVSAIYLSESGGDSRVPARTAKIDIYGNLLSNNWSGVTAWENADRFCNSPANTSSGYCTKSVPSTSTCSSPGINSAPLYSDCRWKTQNVAVHNNSFAFDPTAVGCTNGLCGGMAVLSNWGTYPSWSPYQGQVIEDAVTTKQNNVWSSNVYSGPWKFMAHDTGVNLTSSAWSAAPYNQDLGSTFNGTVTAPAPTPTTSPSPSPTTSPSPSPSPTTSPSPSPTTSPSPSPTTSPTPVQTGNALDANTAGAEASIGQWVNWYSAKPARTTTYKHSGTAGLQITATASYGWGLQLANWPGFTTSAGARNVSFWIRSGSTAANNAVVGLKVTWKNDSGTDLGSTTLNSPKLTSSWQKAAVAATAPAGTTHAWLTLTGSTAVNSIVQVDDIYVGS